MRLRLGARRLGSKASLILLAALAFTACGPGEEAPGSGARQETGTPGAGADQAPGQVGGQAAGQAPGQAGATGQATGQAPGQPGASGQASGQTEAPGQAGEQAAPGDQQQPGTQAGPGQSGTGQAGAGRAGGQGAGDGQGGAGEQLDMAGVQAEEEFRWGVQAYHNGLYNEAVLAFNRALSFAPENARIRYWLGRAYYFSGFEQAALQEWRGSMEDGNGSPFLRNLIDVVSTRRGLSRELHQRGRFVVTNELAGGSNDRRIFRRPVAVEPRPDGSFYLTAFGSNDVILLNANGSIRRRLEGGISGFNRPFDVAHTAEDFLFVSEFGADRVAKVRPDGRRITVFGGSGSGEGQLRGPQYITTDADRYLYVTDWGNQRVVKFSYDGDYVLSFGEATGEFGGFSEPTGIAFDEGRIYVADRARQAIYMFDESGNFLSGIADIGLQNPESIEVFGPNRLLVSDSSRLVLVNTQDETVSEFSEVQNYSGRVTSAALDANGRIVAADFDQNRLLFLSEISSLYSGLFVRIERVNATQFPTVYVDVAVENRLGRPIVGLETRNFFLSESRQAMANPEVVWAAHRSSESEVSVLIERSPMIRRQQDRMEDLASQLNGLRQGDLSMRVISAGESATVEANPGVSGTRFTEAVLGSGYSSAWSFDSGLRFAASELIPVRKSRAVIYVSSGRLPDDAFNEYGLEVLAQYMKNNHIQFFPVYLTQDAVPDELQFLARETGGQSYYLYNPEGIGGIREDIRRHQSGRYTIRAQSRSASDFGRAYIPLELEAYLIRQSGRDEAGYYAPLQF